MLDSSIGHRNFVTTRSEEDDLQCDQCLWFHVLLSGCVLQHNHCYHSKILKNEQRFGRLWNPEMLEILTITICVCVQNYENQAAPLLDSSEDCGQHSCAFQFQDEAFASADVFIHDHLESAEADLAPLSSCPFY